MLAIRMQRTGRKGHAQFRVIAQDSRFSPTSGRVVAYLGTYDPHSKVANLDKEKLASYLSTGAQPSDRVARLLQKEGVELPEWVKLGEQKQRETRNPQKLRSNRPADVSPAETASAAEEKPSEEVTETPADEPEKEMKAQAEEPSQEDTKEKETASETQIEPTTSEAETTEPESSGQAADSTEKSKKTDPKTEKPAG